MDLHPYQNNRKSYDKNGFQQGQKQNKIMNYLANNTQLDQERYLRWELLLPKIDQLRAQNKQGQKMLINYVRLGVYDPFRNKVWPKLIQEPLVPFQECKYKGQNKDINLDLERTFPTHKQAKAIEEKLKVVLNSIAIALPQVGYCQGMNFIVGILLLKLNEQDAYKVAFHIFHWQKHQQLMKDLALIHEKLYALNRLIKKHYPKLYKLLHNYEIQSIIYASSWFITLYCNSLPACYAFRIIECYLMEGIQQLSQEKRYYIEQRYRY